MVWENRAQEWVSRFCRSEHSGNVLTNARAADHNLSCRLFRIEPPRIGLEWDGEVTSYGFVVLSLMQDGIPSWCCHLWRPSLTEDTTLGRYNFPIKRTQPPVFFLRQATWITCSPARCHCANMGINGSNRCCMALSSLGLNLYEEVRKDPIHCHYQNCWSYIRSRFWPWPVLISPGRQRQKWLRKNELLVR